MDGELAGISSAIEDACRWRLEADHLWEGLADPTSAGLLRKHSIALLGDEPSNRPISATHHPSTHARVHRRDAQAARLGSPQGVHGDLFCLQMECGQRISTTIFF